MLSSGPLFRPRAAVLTRLLAPPRAPRSHPRPASSHPQVYYPGTPARWWGSRWLRAGPVRSLPRNRGGKRRRPREVEGPERVVSPEVEVAEEGYGQRRERSSRLYRGGGCESRELDRQLVHDPDRLLFQGFRFPVRGHPFARTRRFSPYPAVSDPSLHLTFTSLIFRRPFFTVPPLFLLDFRSYPFANRCLSLSESPRSAELTWRTPCACGLCGWLRVSASSSSCSPVFIVSHGLLAFASHPVRTMRDRIVHARGTTSPNESNYG